MSKDIDEREDDHLDLGKSGSGRDERRKEERNVVPSLGFCSGSGRGGKSLQEIARGKGKEGARSRKRLEIREERCRTPRQKTEAARRFRA